MTKPRKWPVCPAKTPITLGSCPVWSESLLLACRKLGSLATHWAYSEDSDQTGWMPRLIWVIAGHTGHFVGFIMLWLSSCAIALHFYIILGQKRDFNIEGAQHHFLGCKNRIEPPHDKTSKMTRAPSPGWSESSLGAWVHMKKAWTLSLTAWRKLGPLASYWVHSDDWSDWADSQADWVFAGCTCHFVGFVMLRLWCFTTDKIGIVQQRSLNDQRSDKSTLLQALERWIKTFNGKSILSTSPILANTRAVVTFHVLQSRIAQSLIIQRSLSDYKILLAEEWYARKRIHSGCAVWIESSITWQTSPNSCLHAGIFSAQLQTINDS